MNTMDLLQIELSNDPRVDQTRQALADLKSAITHAASALAWLDGIPDRAAHIATALGHHDDEPDPVARLALALANIAGWIVADLEHPSIDPMNTNPKEHQMPSTAALIDTERDQLAEETARHIVEVLNPQRDEFAALPGVTMHYVGVRRPPTTIEDVKAALLAGDVWLSWLDDQVTSAMKKLHPDA